MSRTETPIITPGMRVGGSFNIPIECRDAKIILLWVDDKLAGENKSLMMRLPNLVPNLYATNMTSTRELTLWLSNYASDISQKLRIIR